MRKLIILLLVIAAITSGCKKDFDPEIYGKLSPNTFPSTAYEYELYTMEVYVPFEGRWGYPTTTTSGWEYDYFSPELGNVEMFDMSTDLMPTYTGWGGHWQAISSGNFAGMKSLDMMRHHFEKVRIITRVTKIIDDLQKSTVMAEPVKNGLIGEAKMARGWSMYYLLHLYGPVPVILDASKIGTNAESDLTRPSHKAFVDSIISDLRYAADNLPVVAANYGRFTKGAALTQLMRLYLNEKDFVNAEKVGREIVAMKKYKLVSDYASMFTEAKEVNDETIWAVSCTGGKESGQNFNAFAFYCYPSDCDGIKVIGGGYAVGGAMLASWKFYNSFDTLDVRRKLFKTSYYSNAGKKPLVDSSKMKGAIICKYPDEVNEKSLQGNDIVVSRYADVMLMLAEAINENSGPTSEAIDFINQIRKRAKIAELSAAETASKDALREAIFVERGHELYFEGLRKFDLDRMGKWTQDYMGQYGKTIGPSLWPIPDYAIINSNGTLTQNDGY